MTEKPVCQHFLSGTCTRGDKCRFSHVLTSSESTGPDVAAEPKAKISRARVGATSRRKRKDWLSWGEGRAPIKGDDDDDAPICSGHSEKCVRRTVAKEDSKKHGRLFYSCRFWQNATKSCGHFAWAAAVQDDIGGPAVDTATATTNSENDTTIAETEEPPMDVVPVDTASSRIAEERRAKRARVRERKLAASAKSR